MEKEEIRKEEQQEESQGIYKHMLKAREEAAMVFPHNTKLYKIIVNNYQGVKLPKAAVQALGRK